MLTKNDYKKIVMLASGLVLGYAPCIYAEAAPVTSEMSQTSDTANESLGQPQGEETGSGESAKQPEARETNYFDVFEYQVEGNTLLPKGQVEQAVYPYMGEHKTIDDVEKARETLEKAYRKAGYLTVLVDIPEQDVDKKIVRLHVTEGKVGRLRVSGSHYYSLGRIKALAASLAEGGVPYFPNVQKDIGTLNRTADKRVTPVMKAGKVFGTVDVDLKVEDSLPLHASLELNDRYSKDTTRWRLSGMVRYDNLWQREHSLSLQFQTSPENTDEVQVLSANYLYRFDDSDTMLAFYGVRSKSNVATVGGINILGNGTILGARVILPLPSLEFYYHSLSLGVDYKHFGQSVVFGGTFETPVTYAPLSATYNATEQDQGGQTQFTSSIGFGIRGLINNDAEFAAKRVGAQPNFFVFKADVQRTQKLPWELQGFAHLDGQFTGQPLISNEQYAAGGAESVRGYLESELMGDRALHATLELRTPPMLRNLTSIQDFRLLAFYDVAKLWDYNPTAGQKELLAGVGLGARMKVWKNFNANLDFAWPLRDGETTKSGDFTSHVRLWYEF